MKKKLIFASGLLLSTLALADDAAAPKAAANAGMGQALFEQPGTNSCMYCHGISGEGGKIAVAAKLSHPKTWKTFKGLGGESALKKNKKEFLERMETLLVDLIKKGAIVQNGALSKVAYYDIKGAGGTYDGQMVGITGAPSQAWLRKFKDKGVDKDIAAKAAYLHIQSLDKDGLFK